MIGMLVPPYTTDNGITYLADNNVSLDGFIITNAFISDCSGKGSYTFTFNVTKMYNNFLSLQIEAVSFNIAIPHFDSKSASIRLAAGIEFYSINGIWHPLSFVTFTIGLIVGIKFEVGYIVNTKEWDFKLQNSGALVLGAKFLVDINIKKSFQL